ncbi:MAG: hypothetical protein CSB55_03600 [Candidatus Cloacimonadota bacterium]|nr:MAG: hypothetical protein CSB55_03600 [Candidatus Cloacimonadota bacterium]
MNRRYIFLLTLIGATLCFAQPKDILFIGNSITYFNQMPQVFEQIADSKNDSVSVTVYAPGGTGIVHHCEDPQVYEYFRQGNWHYIVIQPGSGESPGYSYEPEITLERINVLLDSIYVYNPCVQVLFYEISYGVWGNSEENVASFIETMDLILNNFTYWADETRLFFAPVGEAFRASWLNDLDTMLWGSTGDIHPNAKGSYLASCVFYNAVFQRPSSGSDVYASLDPEDALHFQALADSVTLNHLEEWRINVYNSFLDFNYTQQENMVEFENISSGLDEFLWDFGDGETSDEASPVHIFRQPGIYAVTLSSDFGHDNPNGCCHKKSVEIEIDDIFIDNEENSPEAGFALKLYPNPFLRLHENRSENIKISFHASKKESVNLTVFNLKGQKIKSLISDEVLRGQQNIFWDQTDFNGKKVTAGIYFFKLSSATKSEIEKCLLLK